MPARSGNEGTLYRIGTWNDRLLRNGECELIWEIEQYNINFLGLSEGERERHEDY